MFVKEFEVRWSDIDANRHLGNSAYTNFCSHTRMSYLETNGFGHRELAQYNMGPVAFYEHMYYFKEVIGSQSVFVTLEVDGFSEGGMFFKFIHNFYNKKGNHLAHCEMLGAWMDLKTRTITDLPLELRPWLDKAPKSATYQTLTKADTRKFQKVPVAIDPETLV